MYIKIMSRDNGFRLIEIPDESDIKIGNNKIMYSNNENSIKTLDVNGDVYFMTNDGLTMSYYKYMEL
mgnify:FL=1